MEIVNQNFLILVTHPEDWSNAVFKVFIKLDEGLVDRHNPSDNDNFSFKTPYHEDCYFSPDIKYIKLLNKKKLKQGKNKLFIVKFIDNECNMILYPRQDPEKGLKGKNEILKQLEEELIRATTVN